MVNFFVTSFVLIFVGLIGITAFISWKYYSLTLKEEKKVKIIVAANNGGQLCNQLWHFARLAAFCKERGYELYNPAFFHYAKHFEHFQYDLAISATNPFKFHLPIVQELQRRAHRIISYLLKSHFLEKRYYCTGPELLVLPPTDDHFEELAFGNYFFFDWHFTNPVGLEKHRDYLMELLKPKKSYQKNIEIYMANLDPSRLIVGVHVRHGDFRFYCKGSLFFSIEEIKKQMSEISNRYHSLNPQFIICSNEPRSPSEFSEFDVKLGPGNFIEDLYCLAKCDLILGVGGSTYNDWAAWYGKVPRIKMEEKPNWEEFDKLIFAKKKATI